MRVIVRGRVHCSMTLPHLTSPYKGEGTNPFALAQANHSVNKLLNTYRDDRREKVEVNATVLVDYGDDSVRGAFERTEATVPTW